MNSEIIEFIGISYDELRTMPLKELENKIVQNIRSYFEAIPNMNIEELKELQEDVKNTRKQKFRFSQEITSNIPKDRIHIALTHLAKLFRKINDQIKDQRNT